MLAKGGDQSRWEKNETAIVKNEEVAILAKHCHVCEMALKTLRKNAT